MSSCLRRAGQSGRVGVSNTRKRARNIPKVPHALERRGQQARFGEKVVNQEEKQWYESYDEIKYYPNVPIDVGSLHGEYPQILRWCLEIQLGFLFQEPWFCNLSLV